MSKFKTVKQPTSEAVAAFAAGANEETVTAGKHTGYPFKMTKQQRELLGFVLMNSTDKSIQQLLENIIWPEIERRARALNHD